MISIVLPTFLGKYSNAAKDRDLKLTRAIQSVIQQKFQDWQLIVVCDGCERSLEIVKENPDPRIKGILIDKQPMFSGNVRNVGISYSEGDWICYLDADDFFGCDHLDLISREMSNGYDWLFFNDFILRKDKFQERTCYYKTGHCGTSNIAHKRSMRARWDVRNRYGTDDWIFIQRLVSESNKWKKCEGQYLVCHIPRAFDI